MTTRRATRPVQVRPRPPSTGRPAPERLRPRVGRPPNLAQHRPIERGRGLPLAVRLVLIASVMLLGAVVLWTITGQLGRIVAGVGSSLSGIVLQIGPSPTPSPTPPPPADSPALIAPSQSYTNEPTVTLNGTLPTAIAGDAGYRIRIYRTVGDAGGTRTLVREQKVPSTPQFSVVDVTLEKGADFFTATLIGPGGETKPSAPIRVVYDISKPRIILASPQDGQTINARAVQLQGQVQSGSVIVARNEANGASVTGKSGADGTFSMTLGLEPGTNGITLNTTDPAGNTSSLVISVLRGSGKLTASLTPSAYQFSAKKLPQPLTLTAIVTDPDGHAVDGAAVTFTLSIPGIPPVTQDGTTDGAGSAVFQTNVPKGATPGNGLGTILVDTKKFGSISARTVIAIAE